MLIALELFLVWLMPDQMSELKLFQFIGLFINTLFKEDGTE